METAPPPDAHLQEALLDMLSCSHEAEEGAVQLSSCGGAEMVAAPLGPTFNAEPLFVHAPLLPQERPVKVDFRKASLLLLLSSIFTSVDPKLNVPKERNRGSRGHLVSRGPVPV